jgi:hypothetical protein
MIDFSEIDWEIFEDMSEELLNAEGLETRRLGRGPGQLGKDIIAWEPVVGPISLSESRKWLVECKYTNENGSIGEKDIFNIVDRVKSQDAHGYILITNARLKVNLERTLSGLKSKIGIDLWGTIKITEKIIINNDVFRRYFPKSFNKYLKDNRLIYLNQIALFRSPLGYIYNYLQFIREAPVNAVSNEICQNIINDLLVELKKIIDVMDEQLRIIRLSAK